VFVLAVAVKGSKVLVVPEAILSASGAPYGFIGIGFAALAGATALVAGLTVMRNRRRAALRAQQHDSVRMFDLMDKRPNTAAGAPRESNLDHPTLVHGAPAQTTSATTPPDICLPR
jgi:hypothetical protein